VPNAPSVVQAALSRVGKPYQTGSAGPNAFDCSGLVVWSYAQAGNTKMPHKASMQHDCCPPVEQSQIRPGDLFFFADSPNSGPIAHVGMYVGTGSDGKPMMVHAPYPGRTVEVVRNVFKATWYKDRIVGVGRVNR
jgi:cell wall-associated NlpC family hydrolase